MKNLHSKLCKAMAQLRDVKESLFFESLNEEERKDYYKAYEHLENLCHTIYSKMSNKQKGL